jgi:hypothetical protein
MHEPRFQQQLRFSPELIGAKPSPENRAGSA